MRIVQSAQLGGKQGCFRPRLGHADAWSEPAKDTATQVFAMTQPVTLGMNERIETEGQPEIGRGHAGTDKVVRCNSDDCKGGAIEADALAQHGGIAGKPSLPVILADENRRRGRELRKTYGFESATAQGGNP